MGENKLFLVASFAGAGGGGVGGRREKPKVIKKLLLGAEFYVTITEKRFPHSPKFFKVRKYIFY